MKDRPLIFVRLLKGGNKGQPLELSDKILEFRYEDEERKADKFELTIDNGDLSEFDNPTWKKGGILEVSWGYPGNMTKPRRVTVQKVSGNQTMKVEAHGLEMLLNKAKIVKVYQGKTLYQLAAEARDQLADALGAYDEAYAPKAGSTQTTEKNEQAEEAKNEGFKKWYAKLAAKYNLERNPDHFRHFYDYRAMYADVVAGKVKVGAQATWPAQYRRGIPSMWIRNEDQGDLYNAQTGRRVTEAEMAKVAKESRPKPPAPVIEAAAPEPGIDEEAKKIKIANAQVGAQTYAQFVSTQARKYGYHFYVDHTGFNFKPVDKVYKQRPAKTLTWFNGQGEWLEFSYENDGGEKPTKITKKGVDPLTGKVYEEKAGNDDTERNGLAPRIVEMSDRTGAQTQTDRVPKSWVAEQDKATEAKAKSGKPKGGLLAMLGLEEDVSPSSSSSPENAKASVDGKFKKKSGHAHELTGTIIGDPKFVAKSILQVEGLGRRLSGKWAIKSVEHKIDSSGYTCSFKSERDGDNGYGQKGEATSKASQNKSKPKPEEKESKITMPLHMIDQRTGQTWATQRTKQDGET